MTKVTATLGRNFIRSKEFQEAQLMGLDTNSTNGGTAVNGVNENINSENKQQQAKEKQRSIRHKLVSLTLKVKQINFRAFECLKHYEWFL